MSTDPARRDTRPTRPAADYEIGDAYRENDRRELTAILAAAGFQPATFTTSMTTATPGFAVRSDGPCYERTGIVLLSITLELRYVQDYDDEIDAKTLGDWLKAIERAGGWDAHYDPEYPRDGIVAKRRALAARPPRTIWR
jgi:hypothetical protein